MSENVAEKTGAENVAWDLTHLYTGTDDPKIEQDMQKSLKLADELSAEYKGRVPDLDAEELRDLLEKAEVILEIGQIIGAYAYLDWSTATGEPAKGALLQKSQEYGSQLEQRMLWFELEWAEVPEEQAQTIMNDPVLAEKYRHFLEVSRLMKPYLLTEPEEKILSEKDVTGHAAWYRFFDETHSARLYEWEGEQIPQQVLLTKLFSTDRETRRKAQQVMTDGLKDMARTTTFVFNTILADKASTDRLRKFPSWLTARNISNEVEDDSVQALIDAVTSRYDVVARYYTLKGKLLGIDDQKDYDRYAPLPAADRDYSWKDARALVLESYRAFHPQMADITDKFFKENWIDAPTRPGKTGGAYSMPATPSTHPYVFMNFEGKPRDVMTLAHELGHGVHQYLYKNRGMFQGRTPLTTAETASVFGEMLVFQEMMRREDSPEVRLAMLTGKLEDSFATVFRQISMNRFEDAIHNHRRDQGELSTDQFNEHWLKTQRDMFQGSVEMTENYGYWWSYVPHFVDRPGYVYAYAFGELLVLALYARYEEVGEGFADGYIDMLSAGGSDWPHQIVAEVGVDLQDPDFWKKGVAILDDMVKDAEKLAAEVG